MQLGTSDPIFADLRAQSMKIFSVHPNAQGCGEALGDLSLSLSHTGLVCSSCVGSDGSVLDYLSISCTMPFLKSLTVQGVLCLKCLSSTVLCLLQISDQPNFPGAPQTELSPLLCAPGHWMPTSILCLSHCGSGTSQAQGWYPSIELGKEWGGR